MTEDAKGKRAEQPWTDQPAGNQPTPTHGAISGGPPTPGRAGEGMGVGTGDYTDAPARTGDGPGVTRTSGLDTGQHPDAPGHVSDVPPTPHDDAPQRVRRREEGLE